MKFELLKRKVEEFLVIKYYEYVDLLRSNSEELQRVDRLACSRKKEFIHKILLDEELLDSAYRVEVVTAIASLCDYTKKHDMRFIPENGIMSLPFGMFGTISVNSGLLKDCHYDSEELREYFFDKFDLAFYDYDHLVESKDNGYRHLEYRSGVVINDNDSMSYRLVEHPYLLDKDYILNNENVPQDAGGVLVNKFGSKK